MFLKFLFACLILLRILLFLVPSFRIDMGDWEAWSYRLVAMGFSNFYSQNYFSDYFPGYLYILWAIGNIYHFIFSSLQFSNFKFEVLIKLVTTAFDVGTAYFIYKAANRYSPKLSKIGAFLYLINPAVIFNSSVWGQVDGVFTFFLVYSSYLLIEKKKPVASSFSSALSILIKPHALVLLPVSLIFILKNLKSELILSIVVVFISVILLSIPFFPKDPIFGLFNLAQISVNTYPFNSLFAFNFWGMFGWWKPDNEIFIFSIKTWGIILYILSILFIVYPLLKKKIYPFKFYLATSLSFLSFYLFMSRMHERYLLPFFVFILIASMIKRSKFLLVVYFGLSIIHFINLWYVYYYYNFIYNNSVKSISPIFKFIDLNHWLFSAASIIFLLLLFKFYYDSKKFSE